MVEMQVLENEWGCVTRIYRDEYRPFYIESFSREEAEHRGTIFCELCNRFGEGIEVVSASSVLPVEVAKRGKASMAAYLYSIHQLPVKEVSESLGFSERTVEQYLSDYRYGRR